MRRSPERSGVIASTTISSSSSSSTVMGGDEDRGSWGNYWEFFLTSLGLAVGLGNVWRFPYVAYTNGGGSFLIPYILMLFVVGIPCFFVELSLGQYARVGANKVYGRMSPAFKGLGYAMLIVRELVNIYYVVICAWAFFYLFAGFQSDLPWDTCEEEWNTVDCYTLELDEKCDPGETYYDADCVSNDDYCAAHGYDAGYDAATDSCVGGAGGAETLEEVIEESNISPAEDYFNGKVLGLTKNREGEQYSWDDYGTIQWELALCLLLSWIVVCLILIKGIQSLGKAAYVITLSPYVVLTALIAYAATLEGAGNGIDYFLQPDWEKLTDIDIWSSAASQILFSLSLGYGSQLILASYNEFTNNTHRDAILIGICNSLTSLYAGFVVFAILGFLAQESNSDIDSVGTCTKYSFPNYSTGTYFTTTNISNVISLLVNIKHIKYYSSILVSKTLSYCIGKSIVISRFYCIGKKKNIAPIGGARRYQSGVRVVSDGGLGDGPAPLLVFPLLLHAHQPGPVKRLWGSPGHRRLRPGREALPEQQADFHRHWHLRRQLPPRAVHDHERRDPPVHRLRQPLHGQPHPHHLRGAHSRRVGLRD